MAKVCFGFEVHQPFRLNNEFSPDKVIKKKDIREIYFHDKNREILERVIEKCYIPATEIIINCLDEGFRCAFSISGTLIEQLEMWGREALQLFSHIAAHKNAEIIAQTYYHSLASLFIEKDEFEEQIRLHRQLMKDTFGKIPIVFENTEFIFNNDIAAIVKKLGFDAICAEGVERVLGWRSPNYLYSCQGITVLMRNYVLSDDIAFRFSNREWNQNPLTAEKYASWIAATQGDCITIFIDYETFGEHHWKESGILEFLRWLPFELAEKGNECVLPSEAAKISTRDEVSVPETISWADIEKDTSAWLGNNKQVTAFRNLERAKLLIKNKTIWRYLQTSDHFHYMSSKCGSCGDVHSYFRQEGPFESFATYMRVLSDYEERSATAMRTRKAAFGLRCLPPERAFHFHSNFGYTGYSAYSLDEFAEQLEVVPSDSITYHVERNDFSQWIAYVIGDSQLASDISNNATRHVIVEAVNRRREYLWSRLK